MSSAAGRRRNLPACAGPGVRMTGNGVGAGEPASVGCAGMKLGVAVARPVVLGAASRVVIGLAAWDIMG